MALAGREEIRWKFQMLTDSLRISLEEIENQMKTIDEIYLRNEYRSRNLELPS